MLSFPTDVAWDETLADELGLRHEWINAAGRPDRSVIHGRYRRHSDYQASWTDPDATLMRRAHTSAHLGYHTHYVVDGGKARIILSTLVTPSSVMENQPMLDLLWRTSFRWKFRPRIVCGDTTYGTVENIVPIERSGIRAYLPLPDFTRRTAYYGKDRFTYDAEHDCYWCPQGQPLPRFTQRRTEQSIVYRADPATCNCCPVKAKCTRGVSGRSLQRSIYASYLERVESYHETDAYRRVMGKRKVWVEPLFGEAKQWHRLRRFRLRRLEKVNMEALMIAAGQNIKRLIAERHPEPLPGDESRSSGLFSRYWTISRPICV